MLNEKAKEHVLACLEGAGFEFKKKKANLYEVQKSRDSGDGSLALVQIRSAGTWKGVPLGSFEKIHNADTFVIVKADHLENLKAYVYPTEYIARATRISETPEGFPFERNPGDKNPNDRDFWVRSKWRFCKDEHLNAWHLIGKFENSPAIEDINQSEIGSTDPEYRMRMSGTYVRDDQVRKQVLDRAQGRCEYCGGLGFKRSDSSHYVETHHIISLAQQGPDTLDNVIALCPNHHREAHFGVDWEQLEAEFKTKLAKLRGKNQ